MSIFLKKNILIIHAIQTKESVYILSSFGFIVQKINVHLVFHLF